MRIGFSQTLSYGSKKPLVHLHIMILGPGKPDAKNNLSHRPHVVFRNNKYIVPTYTVPFIRFLSSMPLHLLEWFINEKAFDAWTILPGWDHTPLVFFWVVGRQRIRHAP